MGKINVAAAIIDSSGRPAAVVHIVGRWSPSDFEKRSASIVVDVTALQSHQQSVETLGMALSQGSLSLKDGDAAWPN